MLLAKHRRKVLRCCKWSNTNTISDPNRDSYGYGDGNAYANCDAMHGKMYTYAKAASDAIASPVALTQLVRCFPTQCHNEDKNPLSVWFGRVIHPSLRSRIFDSRGNSIGFLASRHAGEGFSKNAHVRRARSLSTRH